MTSWTVRRVLLTRPWAQNEWLAEALRAQGVAVWVHPLLRLVENGAALSQLSAQILAADDVIWISPSAIERSWLAWAGLDDCILKSKRYAVVGRASFECLREKLSHEFELIYPKHGADAKSLLNEPHFLNMTGRAVLLIGGENGRDELPNTLTKRGAKVELAAIYRREVCAMDWAAFDLFSPEAILLSSREVATMLFKRANARHRVALCDCSWIVPHETIAAKLNELGASRVTIAHGRSSTLCAFETLFR